MLKSILESQRIYLFKQRRDMIKAILILCQQAPMRLSALCRRKIRQSTKSLIDKRIALDSILPKNLQQYLIIDELKLFLSSLTSKRLLFLIQQSISYNKLSSNLISSFNELCS
ncbi:unnamed protein product [Adineta steineri]|uniref:Uncharacterized protein n=2 Tax=Adineta steineri TaxID=433720 RepID=A0A814S9B1_9BILA|nr:unnamed protein product [Adineta steineri]